MIIISDVCDKNGTLLDLIYWIARCFPNPEDYVEHVMEI